MKALLLSFFLSLSTITYSQSTLVSKLKPGDVVPQELLASRSVVLYDPSYRETELEEIQKAFSQIGIDAEAYFEEDVVMAGRDVTLAYANYFTKRGIKFLVLLDRSAGNYRLTVTSFNNKSSLIDAGQPAWVVSNASLQPLLTRMHQDSWISQKKQNFLINEIPETGIQINWINGNRSEFFAIDLKVDRLAVPFFENASMDTTLNLLMKEIYPLKYNLTNPATDEQELRKKGFMFILCRINTRAIEARQLLGYTIKEQENAYISITYPDGAPQLKTIAAETPIYKFYVKHIPSGNIFLGTKWDADTSWDQALRNYIKGFKAELKIN